jgi:serine/threonine protein kinase
VRGTRVGRYTLIEPIGRGGMAEVWKAHIHGAHGFARVVVLKRILPHLISDPDFVRQFTTEALLSARLDHPNIIKVFEFCQIESEHFLVMEYVEGVSLATAVRQLLPTHAIPIGMAVYIVREICRALGYAHGLTDEAGRPLSLIHRDVSPSNVMIGVDGHVKLLDFGIAKALNGTQGTTRSGSIKGKFSYLAPEAVDEDGHIDQRADLFAAGVILHELLVGQRLFKGRDDVQTIALVRKCEIPAPSSQRREVSRELDAICAKALARAPADRYQTADEMLAALSSQLHELRWDVDATAAFLRQHGVRPVVADDPGETVPRADLNAVIAKPGRRRWRTIGLAGLICALALAVLMLARSRPATRAAADPPPTVPAMPAAHIELPEPEHDRATPAAVLTQESPARATVQAKRKKKASPATGVDLRRGDLLLKY